MKTEKELKSDFLKWMKETNASWINMDAKFKVWLECYNFYIKDDNEHKNRSES